MDTSFLRSVRPDELRLLTEINDDACLAYGEYGLSFDLREDHPFVLAEAARWKASALAGHAFFACAPDPVGFVALGFLDGKPHLDQVSVRRAWARRGIGTALVVHAQRWSLPRGELWLTTYDGVPFNRPFYERLGFDVAAPGPELSATLDEERAALPAPERRISMRYRILRPTQ